MACRRWGGVDQKGGSLKQANPELAARKVKERGGAGEHFKQRQRHMWRPEAVRPSRALGQIQLSTPTPTFLGGA